MQMPPLAGLTDINIGSLMLTDLKVSVPIGFPRPLIRKRVLPPPPGSQGWGQTRLWERGWGEPIRTKGQTSWYSSYITILIRLILSA